MRRTLVVLALALAACGGEERDEGVLEVWFHSGQAAERAVIEAQVARFNAEQDEVEVRLTMLPEQSYNSQVQSAALAGELPDVLEFDGPYLYSYVWQGHLVPMGDRLSKELVDDLLPSIVEQGTYAGRLWSVGTFDSGLGIYARRSRLEEAGVRVPGKPWTIDEFDAALAALAEKDADGAVLDLKLDYSGEWFTYAFAPTLRSAGGGLVSLEDEPHAGGVLDGEASHRAMERVQAWFRKDYVDPDVDGAAFTEGRVALSWVGHWTYPGYREAVGEDLVILPLPDFGEGSRTGQGSWNWGVTKRCARPDLAVKFLEFLLRPDEVLAMADANGAVPATRTAIARSKLYGEDGPLRLFARQLQDGTAVPRPRTPAYPVITSAFQRAFLDIRNGADVGEALGKAARAIDQDVADNQGYRLR